MSQVIEALKWRYATKKFNPNKTLSEAKLSVLKEAFDLTATSFGLQPVRLVVVSDTKVQQTLVPLSMGQQQVVDASHLLVFCIEKKVDAAFVEAYFENIKSIRNTSEEILNPFRDYLGRCYSSPLFTPFTFHILLHIVVSSSTIYYTV